jgi:hypothetical protein
MLGYNVSDVNWFQSKPQYLEYKQASFYKSMRLKTKCILFVLWIEGIYEQWKMPNQYVFQ